MQQSDLALELGVGRTTISNYEQGVTVPKKLVINAWAAVCDVDVEWLKTGDEQGDEGPRTGGPLGASSEKLRFDN